MDLANLVTVEYTINYNQAKLEQVIKQLEGKLVAFNKSIEAISERCQSLERQDNSMVERVDKFEQFTIENLHLTINQYTSLKQGLRNYLGEEWVKEEEKVEIEPKSRNLKKTFQSKLSAFNSQARHLNQRVSQLQTQLTKKTSHHETQSTQVQKAIKQHSKHISRIRQSIQEGIQQKFSQYRKQFQQKNLKQIYKKVQIASDNSMKSMAELQEKSQQALQKAMRQFKRVSITNNIESMNELAANCNPTTLKEFSNNVGQLESCGKLIMGKMDFGEMQDVIDCEANVKNSHKHKIVQTEKDLYPQENNEINDLRKSANMSFLKYLSPPSNIGNNEKNSMPNAGNSQNSQYVEGQAVQHLISQLREQLKNMVKSDMLEFKTTLELYSNRSQKMDVNVNFLLNELRVFKDQLSQQKIKTTEIRADVDNQKNTLHETAQKHNQNHCRILELQGKLQATMEQLKLISKQLHLQDSQDEDYETTKFRDIQNLNLRSYEHESLNSSKSGIKQSLLLKNSMGTPMLKDDVIVGRVNLLAEKVSKLEERLKGGVSDKNLPKIASQTNITARNPSNTPSMDLLRKDLHKTNQQLNKTNQRLQTVKKSLTLLQSTHSQLPTRMSKLQSQLSSISQIQQDRLLQLIKQLINRVLTDPFNNHFTNTLKRQIHVKFLQIKHEYSSIWKDIEQKVKDRAQTSQLQKLKLLLQQQNLETKTLINKKADNDDFKKGVKYLDTKMKELYSYLKGKEQEDSGDRGKKYYMGKK